MTDYCNNCIRQKVCYLESDTDDGWCENCNDCREKECKNKIKYRSYWTAKSGQVPITLGRDVCEEHILENDCHCSKDSSQKWTEPFTYK